MTLLYGEPPPITTLEFLETMAFCLEKGTVIAWWHGSDTSTEAPGAPRGFSESVQGWSFIVPILVVYNQP